MQAPSWTAIAPQTGPWALCGATTAWWASAMRGDLAGPPQAAEVERLGLEDLDGVVRQQVGELADEVKLSPVAIGTGDRRATSTIEPICGDGPAPRATPGGTRRGGRPGGARSRR